ncbi:hypothetical protein RQP50_16370 [Paenibacillus sp. chi10]|uniref:Uncharacterized protein n=1 Tax=Paenibacillus suaedae TaxID=3077233 RepID=A0AAJ2K0G2_9BACL|nr:hypothetical protein [Paenibacillus sp. chi10]MDT8977812.1 hypothetical protein [Paenibacillus sp. chi10]
MKLLQREIIQQIIDNSTEEKMKKADKITQANGHFILNLDEPTIFLDVFCIEKHWKISYYSI